MEIQEVLKWGHSKVRRQWLEPRHKVPLGKQLQLRLTSQIPNKTNLFT
jgi:hypothetical protein